MFAGAAVAALALTGCGQGGGAGGGGDEPEQEQTTAAPEAPTDYTTEQVQDTLAAATVEGEPLEEVTPTAELLEEAGGEDAVAMVEDLLQQATIEPPECEDPLLGAISGGLLDDAVQDSVVGVSADGLAVTALPMDSKEAADTHVQDLHTAYQDCGEVTMELMGEQVELSMTSEEAEVEGAGAATEQSAEITVDGESVTTKVAVMSVGNVVVTVQDPEQAAASADPSADPSATATEEAADLQPAMEQVAQAFVEGPAEPSPEASATGAATGSASESAS